jgi:ABC-type phosphate transport system substrate-binding protein
MSSLLVGPQGVSALVVAGSDLLVQGIQDALKEQLEGSGMEIELSLQGSLLGLQALKDGSAGAAILAVPDEGQMSQDGNTFPFAYQVVVFAVHSSNPVTELTYAQLTELYQDNGGLNDWSDLTPDLDWRDRKIALWATRSKSSVTLEIFNAVVLKGRLLKDSVRYIPNDTEEIQSILAEDPSALMAIPAIPLNPSIRFLAIKEDDTGQTYTPSEDNVFFGDYPLRLPLFLTVSDSVTPDDLAVIVGAIYSPEVTAALKEANYLPVSAAERQSLLARFE